jgi:hypothetical protein
MSPVSSEIVPAAWAVGTRYGRDSPGDPASAGHSGGCPIVGPTSGDVAETRLSTLVFAGTLTAGRKVQPNGCRVEFLLGDVLAVAQREHKHQKKNRSAALDQRGLKSGPCVSKDANESERRPLDKCGTASLQAAESVGGPGATEATFSK